MKSFVVGYACTTVVGPGSEKTRSDITRTFLVWKFRKNLHSIPLKLYLFHQTDFILNNVPLETSIKTAIK